MLLWIHLLTADCTKKMRTLGRGGGLRLVSSSPMRTTAANVGLILHWYHWCLPLHQTWLVGKSPLQKSSKIRCLTEIDKMVNCPLPCLTTSKICIPVEPRTYEIVGSEEKPWVLHQNPGFWKSMFLENIKILKKKNMIRHECWCWVLLGRTHALRSHTHISLIILTPSNHHTLLLSS